MLRPNVRHIFRMERLTNFKLCIQMENEDPYRHSSTSAMTSKVKVAMARSAYDRCWSVVHKSRTKSPRNIKHLTRNNAHQFQGQRSRSPGRPWGRLMLTAEVGHLPNWKAYELQTWYTVRAWRAASQAMPWPPKSKVMVTKSRGPSDRVLAHKSRTKSPRNSKIGW